MLSPRRKAAFPIPSLLPPLGILTQKERRRKKKGRKRAKK
jgi:hypothetical protein